MKGSSFRYLCKEGVTSIWKNRMMSAASIGVLVACMLLIGFSVLLSMNVNNIVGYLEDQNEVVIFLEDSADEAAAESVGSQLEKMDNIFDLRFISKEEGLKNQSEWLGGDEELLEWLEEDNPLPYSYRLRVKDLSLIAETTQEISSIQGVESVKAPQDVAEIISSVKKAVYVGGGVIIGVLFLVSLLIIANTIKITVFNRRKEINIMKYVGATDSFIRLPFLVEGVLIGTISSMLAYGILWIGYDKCVEYIRASGLAWVSDISSSILSFHAIGLSLFGIFAAIGIGVGAIGSMVFVRKYLKV